MVYKVYDPSLKELLPVNTLTLQTVQAFPTTRILCACFCAPLPVGPHRAHHQTLSAPSIAFYSVSLHSLFLSCIYLFISQIIFHFDFFYFEPQPIKCTHLSG